MSSLEISQKIENTDRHIELDLWIPKYLIGFEFQGEHHFYNLAEAFGPSGTAGLYSERDLLKSSLCQMRGITLITIPYWWDGNVDSLSATLYRARPDVFPASSAEPIPTEMPPGFKVNRKAVSSAHNNSE